MKLPYKYMAACRDASRKQFARVMKSHLIPVGASDGIWERGITKAFKTFRAKRLHLICAAFEKEAGIRLFRKS